MFLQNCWYAFEGDTINVSLLELLVVLEQLETQVPNSIIRSILVGLVYSECNMNVLLP
eukprot:m.203928 g.203928  ORF g.203928 m.203928 type:complete len:58 (+) comp17078_c0_seq1:1287-1460(+)